MGEVHRQGNTDCSSSNMHSTRKTAGVLLAALFAAAVISYAEGITLYPKSTRRPDEKDFTQVFYWDHEESRGHTVLRHKRVVVPSKMLNWFAGAVQTYSCKLKVVGSLITGIEVWDMLQDGENAEVDFRNVIYGETKNGSVDMTFDFKSKPGGKIAYCISILGKK